MAVTDDMVATMRAYVTRDYEQFRRRNAALDQSSTARRSFLALLTAVFAEAVERRFDAADPRTEIIDFVAELRAGDEQIAERLDADAAERMIAVVFDNSVDTSDIDTNTSIGAKLGVIAKIFYDEAPDSAELEEFLDKARVLANEILG